LLLEDHARVVLSGFNTIVTAIKFALATRRENLKLHT
jgi:hypothetical protein